MKTVRDLFYTLLVLLSLALGIVALPFFLIGLIAIFIGYVVFVIVREVRIQRERSTASGKET